MYFSIIGEQRVFLEFSVESMTKTMEEALSMQSSEMRGFGHGTEKKDTSLGKAD